MSSRARGDEITIGTGTSTWSVPLRTSYHDCRMQTIYLKEELGGRPYSFSSLALYITTVPGQTMDNFTIRMRHTDLNSYDSPYGWEPNEWTTCYQNDETISATGWVQFNFTTPFAYDNSRNLMVDISFDDDSASSGGFVRATSGAVYRSLYRFVDSTDGDPLTWSGTSPNPYRSMYAPNVKLACLPVGPKPKFVLDGGMYHQPLNVAIFSDDPNAEVHYTTNGLDPNRSDLVVPYCGTVPVDQSMQLKARAWSDTTSASDIKSATYELIMGTPVFSCSGGAQDTGLNVVVTCPTPGAMIHYTTNGIDPNESDPAIDSGQFIPIDCNMTLKAVATGSGATSSEETTAAYSLGAESRPSGKIVGWGLAVLGVDLSGGFVRISADGPNLGLKADGSIVAWGDNRLGLCNVPIPNTGFTRVAAGGSHCLALKGDGSIVAWGPNEYYGECNVPAPNAGFTDIAAGEYRSLGLRVDGSVAAWGYQAYDECDVPAPNTGFVAIAIGAGYDTQFYLGLKSDGSIVAWGRNGWGECDVPSPNTGFTAVAAGYAHGLGLKADGSVVAWGLNQDGQCDVPMPMGFVAIAAGDYYSMGLRADGSMVRWGENSDVSDERGYPSNNCGFAALAAGSDHDLALKADGSVVGWGSGADGSCNAPTPNADFIALTGRGGSGVGLRSGGAIARWWQYGTRDFSYPSDFVSIAGDVGLAAGGVLRYLDGEYFHDVSPNSGFSALTMDCSSGLAIRTDGSAAAWGSNSYGQNDIPSPNTAFAGVSRGMYHCLGLKDDGSIVAWGSNSYGQCDVPSPNSGFVSVSCGYDHSLGLKADGSVVAWGRNTYGQCDVPSPNAGFTAVSAGSYYSLALRSDGSIVAWGYNTDGRCNVPLPNAHYVAIVASDGYPLAIQSLPEMDLSADAHVTFVDLAILSAQWTRSDCVAPGWCAGTDFDKSGAVDVTDLAAFAESWLDSR